MNELEQKIINSIEDGTFFDVLYEEHFNKINNDNDLIQTLALLNNQRKIDIFSEFMLLQNGGSNPRFFIIRDMLGNLLPLVDAPIEDVKDCIKHLTIEAGDDLASHKLIIPFIEFCSADVSRVDSLLESELKVIDDNFDHISTALISGYKLDKEACFDKAIHLLNHKNPIVVQRVIFALGRFDYTDRLELVKEATKKIISKNRDAQDEQLLPVSIRTLITLLTDFYEIEDEIIVFIESNLDNHDTYFLFEIARQLNYNYSKLSEKTQELLLSFFKKLDTSWLGIVEHIDWYIFNKISNTDAISIAILYEYLLDNNDNSFQVDILSHSLQKLQENKEMLSIIFTKWLLKKDFRYCISAVKLLRTSSTYQIKIGFDASQVKSKDLIYLVKKSIGWFTLQPSTSLSLILSVIPLCSESELELIKNKAFEFIGLNYPSQAKAVLQEYLDSSDKNTMNFSKNLIQKLDDFLGKFNELYAIKELRPSTRQRNEFANHQQKLFDEASSEPTESLFFTNLFTKKITLYGNKFICKHKDSNGETVRQVMPFSKMSHSIDFPSLANLTPHTQEYFLSSLKIEDLTNEIDS